MIGRSVRIRAGLGHWGYKGIVEQIVDTTNFFAYEQDKIIRYVVKMTAPKQEYGRIRIFPETCLIYEYEHMQD